MANPISDFFNNLFQPKGQSVLGVDIGSSSIKVVQLKKKKGRAVLETYGEIALGPYAGFEIGQATNLPVDKLIEAVKDVIKESNITTTNCGIAIPIKSSLVTIVEMPAFNTRQLAQMIPIEARKYIPVPITEVSLDWSIIPNEEEIPSEEESRPDSTAPGKKVEKTDVLVVAIHNEVLTKYQDIVKGANLSSNFFEIEMFSAVRSSLDQDIAPVMVFDMGAGATKIYIVERGVIRGSHIINTGSQNITMNISRSMGVSVAMAEKMKRGIGSNQPAQEKQISEIIDITIDPVFSEAENVMLNYQKRNNKNISKVLLTGGGVSLKGIIEKAKKYLQTEVVFSDPFAKVDAPAFLKDVLKSTGPEFSVAIGIALRKLQEVE
ncbi:type IV pilus assembly protein PilM [Candidatus Nomurabacteria bacterium]|nr:type IV pilus assembly protein PilM [Candidatus Nomurabacteria bacterium]